MQGRSLSQMNLKAAAQRLRPSLIRKQVYGSPKWCGCDRARRSDHGRDEMLIPEIGAASFRDDRL
jgi:hypothetical protein